MQVTFCLLKSIQAIQQVFHLKSDQIIYASPVAYCTPHHGDADTDGYRASGQNPRTVLGGSINSGRVVLARKQKGRTQFRTHILQ